ncbi:Clo7bot family Cys-rich peptide [Paraclostridium ghonii]|uniref:Clo7bot family Cys-rich peptide n=1 Tax=Paraclostridium ghonii TaxID=29358 RepID=UPI00202D0675|nr:Clo7bot family Cys-rich peptide [Paeniclostridium ghonii]MCM0165624.1 Clo7bot family Cys-rich peptide [Paeniclostridium ghonii]
MKFIKKPAKKFEEGYCYDCPNLGCFGNCSGACGSDCTTNGSCPSNGGCIVNSGK